MQDLQFLCSLSVYKAFHLAAFAWATILVSSYLNSSEDWVLNLQMSSSDLINSLAPVRFDWDFKSLIFKLTLMISGWGLL